MAKFNIGQRVKVVNTGGKFLAQGITTMRSYAIQDGDTGYIVAEVPFSQTTTWGDLYHVQLDKLSETISGYEYFFESDEARLTDEKSLATARQQTGVCTCDMSTLLKTGCMCGAIQRYTPKGFGA